MSVKVNIFVSDVIGLLDSGYEKIKVYRSGRKDSDYSEATSSLTRIPLDISKTRYEFSDIFGTEDLWYKWSFYNDVGPLESSMSDPSRGTISGSYFRGITYPPEILITSAEQDVVNRIRQYIGDFKEVNRDYLSPTTSYDNLSTDKKTVELDNPKGWPLSIKVGNTEFNTLTNPIVNGYQFITFVDPISTVSGIVDIWYEHFRISDRDILDAYKTVELPPRLTPGMATFEVYELAASIKLLEGELRTFMVTSSSKVSIYEEIDIDPSSGLTVRMKDLDNLRKKLDDIVNNLVANNLTLFGVRLD